MNNPIFQAALHPCIAIVAPGGYAPDAVGLESGIARLEALGCEVRNYYDHSARHLRFGGTDEARIAQLYAAASDPDVKVVIALRGGYGMSRILPALDYPMLAGSGKLFVGHSDFTAFQLALLAQTNAISFAGPMMCGDFTRQDPSAFTMEHFWQLVAHPTHVVTATAQGNPVLQVKGKLWGGNLAMLTHLIGSPYFPEVENGILFLEDVSEHPYRIERMMLQLLHAGVLSRQKAVLLGNFSEYKLSDYDNGYDFDAMLSYLRTRLLVPVLTGLPFGHIRDKVTLAVGCEAELMSDRGGFQLSMTGYPTL